MIIGMGIDIVDNRRIENTLKIFGQKFKNKCFSNDEILISSYLLNKTNFFAKRYAGKEAFVKALGTGITKGIFWKDIEILNDSYGKPYIQLKYSALKILNKIYQDKFKIDISLSDEKNYSIANVIISKK